MQSVLVRKVEEAYPALSIGESKDSVVKSAILKTYELIPEAYCQRFRSLTKLHKQTYVEFAKEKEALFTIWCRSQRIETKELRLLVLLEEFKNCLPVVVCTHLNELKVTTIDKAAILADDFMLTHKIDFDREQSERMIRAAFNRARFSKPTPIASTSLTSRPLEELLHKKLVSIARKLSKSFELHVLSKKQKISKPVVVIKIIKKSLTLPGSPSFLMDGFVSLGSDSNTRHPIKIWRDSGAF